MEKFLGKRKEVGASSSADPQAGSSPAKGIASFLVRRAKLQTFELSLSLTHTHTPLPPSRTFLLPVRIGCVWGCTDLLLSFCFAYVHAYVRMCLGMYSYGLPGAWGARAVVTSSGVTLLRKCNSECIDSGLLKGGREGKG